MALAAAAALGSCAPARDLASPKRATATPEPRRAAEREGPDRRMPVAQAVASLERHVDVPVVLPRDRLAGIRSYRGWVADPKYLGRDRRGGRGVGTLVLRRKDDVLRIDYGYSIPDGCGGRDTAIPTDVLGAPALLWVARGRVWSQLIWPVRPRGRVGRYGLAGSFDGPEMLRLARSMEFARRAGSPRDPGC